MSVHVFTSPFQPLTRFFDPNIGERGRWFVYRRRQMWRCGECFRRRWAKSLEIQVFYDYSRVRCKDRDGCKEAQTWAMSKRVRRRKAGGGEE